MEKFAARHMGMRVCTISCVTNMAAGIEDESLSHDDIEAHAEEASKHFTVLLKGLIPPVAQ